MKLQFKEQRFQLEAVSAIVDCFEGQVKRTNTFTIEQAVAKAGQLLLATIEEGIGYRNSSFSITEQQVLENIRRVQRRNDLAESRQIERAVGLKNSYQLSVEMETGTGKTYTYIRTMYELHKHYGWSKYIVIVPSIAIREGVLKSFEVMQDHFMEQYGHKIRAEVYNSSRPDVIRTFADGTQINVLIINTQAFNSSGKDARRIYMEQDSFGAESPIDFIKQTNPILIIDEPQSVDGEKTLQSMSEFNPLFTLRYSATHKVSYNKVYRLDALDAYNRHLVKKIEVKGISVRGITGTSGYLYLEQIVLSSSQVPLAQIEFEKRSGDGVKKERMRLREGDSLFELSGGLPAYQHQVVTEINGYQGKVVIGGIELYVGDVVNHAEEGSFRRLQIRETILSHLQKERELFGKGIKVLSLFFIDSVDKYREYGEDGQIQVGEYARIFEEEYVKLRSEFLDLFQQDYNTFLEQTDPTQSYKGYMPTTDYEAYLLRDDARRVHEGYFSIDKKGKSINPSRKRGSEESDDISAYDLIMKDKERLLSFEEPVRFIFSHSALKEGWDNPNVFQICALKNAEQGSQIRRRQEVGRGMRLCVNKRGIRQDYELIGAGVYEINRLTIIASESYEHFAKGLQSEIAETLKDRPQRADPSTLVGRIVQDSQGQEHRLTEEEAKMLNKFLFKADIIDEDDKVTVEGKNVIAMGTFKLPEMLEPYRLSVSNLLLSIAENKMPMVENSRKNQEVRPNANLTKAAFMELWDKISVKTVYEVRFDSEQLINQSKILINANLQVSQRVYEVRTGTLQEGSATQLQALELMKESHREQVVLREVSQSEAKYDIVGEIEARTNLTRRTIVRILQCIEPSKFAMLQRNPEAFIARCSELIKEAQAELIINDITYHKTSQRHEAHTVFTNMKMSVEQSSVLKKHIYDYLLVDSETESRFAEALENSTEVVVYAKLPKSFSISTPIANYTPDWAIVFDQEKVRHIYFVAETKGSDSDMDLRGKERLKLKCASEHFKAISGGTVQFAKVSSYHKLLEIVQPL